MSRYLFLHCARLRTALAFAAMLVSCSGDVISQPPDSVMTPRVSAGLVRIPLRVAAQFTGDVGGDRSLFLPRGWRIQVFYAGGLSKPRFLAWSPDSVLHVADLSAGRILALPDRDHDGVADSSYVAASNVYAHDVKFYRGSMYAAETGRVLKLDDHDGDGRYETRSVLVDGIPTGGNHTTRTIVFDPVRRKLYLSIGSSCNVCRETNRAIIREYNDDGTGGRTYATGIRNAVGMSLNPVTGALWATNNGSDMQGNDVPPEWITVIRDGGFYGHPIAYADQRYFDFSATGEYSALLPITPEDSARVRSMQRFGALVTAHSAPMAIEFSNASMPAGFQTGAFVALRGSWNRTPPSGYRLVYLAFGNATDTVATSVADVMASDTLPGENTIDWMRPVGVETDSRGNIYLTSDDRTRAVFVISTVQSSSVHDGKETGAILEMMLR